MMRMPIAIALTLAISVVLARAQSPTTPAPDEVGDAAVRFMAVDLFIDTADAGLAAYQVDIRDLSGRATIAGIEGGAVDTFRAPPYYDPAALHSEGRIVLAAFTTDDNTPAGKSRVARLHFQIHGEPPADFDIQLIVAADSDGAVIDATPSIVAAPAGA